MVVSKHKILVLLLVILLLSVMLAFMLNEQRGKEGVDYLDRKGEVWARMFEPELASPIRPIQL
jgi:hypothetical protein